MKISIVTATSNSENYILSNINSINMQSYKNYEHIIIDNKSNDKTIDIIKKNGKNLRNAKRYRHKIFLKQQPLLASKELSILED